nr:unnamed protein product [Digitaria exilis]
MYFISSNRRQGAERTPHEPVLIAFGAPPEGAHLLEEHLAAAGALLAGHEAHAAASGARVERNALAAGARRRRRHLAGLQRLGQLAGLVHPADLLGSAQVPPVGEHLREPARCGGATAQRGVELVLEPGVHRQVALVDAHAVAVEDGPRGPAILITTFRPLSGGGGGGGGAAGGASLALASFASILCWNALTRARTMPGNLCISRFSRLFTVTPVSSPAAASGCFLAHSSMGGSSGGGDISSSAFRNAAMTSGSNSGDPGVDFSIRPSASASLSSSLSSRPSMSSHTLITSGSRTGVLAGEPDTCLCRLTSCCCFSAAALAAPTPSSRHFIISSSLSRLSDPRVDDLSATVWCTPPVAGPEQLRAYGDRPPPRTPPRSACLDPVHPIGHPAAVATTLYNPETRHQSAELNVGAGALLGLALDHPEQQLGQEQVLPAERKEQGR